MCEARLLACKAQMHVLTSVHQGLEALGRGPLESSSE